MNARNRPGVAPEAASKTFARVPLSLPEAITGGHLAAARWQMFEKVATELVTEMLAEHWERAAKVHEQWAVRDAERHDSALAKHNHEIAEACRERAQLIRSYPEDFTDTAEVLDLILNEGVRDGVRAAA